MRFMFLSILCLLLVGCTSLIGRVSTLVDAPAPQQLLFTVISKDAISLREKIIVGHIEKKMSERGFTKAPSPEGATVAVHYTYSIGAGVSSSPDLVIGIGAGGTNAQTVAKYPRTFEIAVIDIERSKASGKAVIIWQGTLYSNGASADMTFLGPHFIDVLFENYGKTVTNETFGRVLD